MKQIFLNETPVPNVTTVFNERVKNKHETPLLLIRYCRPDTNRLELVALGDIPIEPCRFRVEARDDGAHIFASGLLTELGAFAGLKGRGFAEWSLCRKIQQPPPRTVSPSRLYLEGPGGIPVTIEKAEVMRRVEILSAYRPWDLRLALNMIDRSIAEIAKEQAPEKPAVIDFSQFKSRAIKEEGV